MMNLNNITMCFNYALERYLAARQFFFKKSAIAYY